MAWPPEPGIGLGTMSDDRAGLMLNMLRAIRAKLDEHDRRFDEVITRLPSSATSPA